MFFVFAFLMQLEQLLGAFCLLACLFLFVFKLAFTRKERRKNPQRTPTLINFPSARPPFPRARRLSCSAPIGALGLAPRERIYQDTLILSCRPASACRKREKKKKEGGREVVGMLKTSKNRLGRKKEKRKKRERKKGGKKTCSATPAGRSGILEAS